MESVFKPKLFTLLRSGISKEQVGRDIMAGIVVGIVALPLAIAFGVASGVSPEKWRASSYRCWAVAGYR